VSEFWLIACDVISFVCEARVSCKVAYTAYLPLLARKF